MEITEIRIKLMESSEDRLRGFCSITIDGCFVVRDLKIIDGTSGPFVAMPSRKLAGHCQRCRHKNHLRASYCNHCGAKLQMDSNHFDSPQKLYADVAHPINSECRELIQNAVIDEFEAELARSNQPGYRSRYDDDFDYEIAPEKTTAESQQSFAKTRVDPPETSVNKPGRQSKPDAQHQDHRSQKDNSDSSAPIIQKGSDTRSVPSAPHSGPPRPRGRNRTIAGQSGDTRPDQSRDQDSNNSGDDGFGLGIFDS